MGCSGTSVPVLALAAVAAAIGFAGCASPGKPKPPTLNLPQAAKDLAATRIGDRVQLHFTPPSRNTDKLPLTGALRLELCRTLRPAATNSAGVVTERPATCTPLPEQAAPAPAPGETTLLVVDVLPPSLRAGAPQLLAYRIQLRNSLGRGTDWSAPAYALAGVAPPPVTGLTATARPGGVLLTWQPLPATATRAETVKLLRTRTSPQPAKSNTGAMPGASTAEPAVQTLQVDPKMPSAADPGGSLDPSAVTGSDYRYVASRVRTVTLEGKTLTLESEISAPVAIAYRDEFPPAAPTGLAAAPEGGNTPAINLSWEPNAEPDLAGYRVYRAALGPGAAESASSPAAAVGSFVCIAGCDATPVPAPFYRDASAKIGERYRYRVTALDHTGHESAASAIVADEIPAP